MSFKELKPEPVPFWIIEKLHSPSKVWKFWESSREAAQLEALAEIASAGLWAAIPLIAPLLVSGSPSVKRESARITAELLKNQFPQRLAVLSMGLHRLVGYEPLSSTALNSIKSDEVSSLATEKEYEWAVFGVLSFHGIGWVREAALDRLAKSESGLEIPFLLYRANDWVGSVANKAHAALQARLATRPVRQLAVTLPVVYLLRSRLRGHVSVIQAEITSRVLKEEEIGFLEDLANEEGFSGFRRWVLRFLISSPRAEAAVATKKLLTDQDPIIRLAAWEHSWKVADLKATALEGIKDPWPVIRRRSLEILSDNKETWDRERLVKALLDPAGSVRATAYHYLKKEGAVDVADFYRRVLSTEGLICAPAVYGLALAGSADDAMLLAAFLGHSKVAVRKAALIAVGSIDSGAFLPEIKKALFDPSPSISKTARQLLVRHVEALGGAYILNLLNETNPLYVRKAGLWLMRELPKWARINAFLEALGVAPEFNDEIRDEVGRWLVTYNRSWQKPTADQLKELPKLAKQYANFLNPQQVSELTNIAEVNSV